MKDELNKYEEEYKLYILSGGQPVPAPVFNLDHIQDPQVGCHVTCKSFVASSILTSSLCQMSSHTPLVRRI